MKTTAAKRPCFGSQCYACDARSVGVRDQRPEGGMLEQACGRHADPTIPSFDACFYCSTPVRKGSIDIDGEHAHKSCHREACRI